MFSELSLKRRLSDFAYKLNRFQNAIVSTIVVCIGLSVLGELRLNLAAFLTIIAAQSIACVNAHDTPLKRLMLTFTTSVVFISVVSLAAFARLGLFQTSLVMLIMALLFSYLKQHYPINWPDMVIPAAALFLMSYIFATDYSAVWYTTSGCLFGILTEFIVLIFLIISGQRFKRMKALPGEKHQQVPARILGLRYPNFVYAAELGALLLISGCLMYTAPFPHSYWAPLTIIMIVQVGNQGAIKRTGQRLLGTLLGCALGTLLLLLLSVNDHPLLFLFIASVVVFFWQYFIRHNYALGSVFVTAFVLLLLGLNQENPLFLAFERMSFSTLGGLMAMGSAALLSGR